jgi:hypothetical protein
MTNDSKYDKVIPNDLGRLINDGVAVKIDGDVRSSFDVSISKGDLRLFFTNDVGSIIVEKNGKYEPGFLDDKAKKNVFDKIKEVMQDGEISTAESKEMTKLFNSIVEKHGLGI